MYCKRSSKLSKSSEVSWKLGKILGLRCLKACLADKAVCGLLWRTFTGKGHSGKSMTPSSLDKVLSSVLYNAVDSQQNFPAKRNFLKNFWGHEKNLDLQSV